ncbi:MAG: TrmH family RNA methyltransferase [Actinobacteria bacterium]|nr:TrmH family RNA methyltransferase [Actinomycetota bacterium]MBW3649566.1 TrmH family RNA methyltransferase [Actinomycetota bacterium]
MSATEAKRLQREWRRRTTAPLGLLLDSVQNPFNLGAILRTAAAFRVDHLWLAGTATTPAHDKVHKTSLGTERLVPWSVVASVSEGAAEAGAAGMQLVGIELAVGAEPLGELDLAHGVCLVLGHEDRGLSPAALDICRKLAYIPTPGKVGSLNVAAAAAIALYDVRRQQWAAVGPAD